MSGDAPTWARVSSPGATVRRQGEHDPKEGTMQYLLTIYEDETFWQTTPPEQLAEVMAGYARFGEEAGEKIVGGHALQPTATAPTVRVRDDERLVTDGPFAETKEQLGGYYLLECKD